MKSDPIIVLVTRGKHESVDYAGVYLFDNMGDAQKFCKSKNTGKIKYWTKAEIIPNGIEIELSHPDDF